MPDPLLGRVGQWQNVAEKKPGRLGSGFSFMVSHVRLYVLLVRSALPSKQHVRLPSVNLQVGMQPRQP